MTATGIGPPPYESARSDGSPPASPSTTSRMRLSIVGITMVEVGEGTGCVCGELEELLARKQLDPVERAETVGDPLSDDDRRGRRPSHQVAQLLVGEAVVDRHERLVRERSAEKSDRQ